MKDFTIPTASLIIGVFVLFAFVGFIGVIKNAFTATKPAVDGDHAAELRENQHRFSEETEEKRKMLMENMRQQMRDNRRK